LVTLPVITTDLAAEGICEVLMLSAAGPVCCVDATDDFSAAGDSSAIGPIRSASDGALAGGGVTSLARKKLHADNIRIGRKREKEILLKSNMGLFLFGSFPNQCPIPSSLDSRIQSLIGAVDEALQINHFAIHQPGNSKTDGKGNRSFRCIQ
jgi:hypothetical protein